MADQDVKEKKVSAAAETKSEGSSDIRDASTAKASENKDASAQSKNSVECGESGRLPTKREKGAGMPSHERDLGEGKNSKKEVCRNYLNKRCVRGALCKYYHPEIKSYGRNRSRSPISEASDSRNAVCRDFVRNICSRGNDCRYFHPPKEEVNKVSWFTLCLDFQSGRCTRHDCRYFHISREDEEHFRQTGEISLCIIDQAMRKAPTIDVATSGSRPTCKDYLKGICKLRTCRFRHVNRREYEDEVYKALKGELKRVLGVPVVKSPPLMSNCGEPLSRGMSSHDGWFNYDGRDNRNNVEDYYPFEYRNASMGRDFYEADAYHNGRGNSPLEDARFTSQTPAREDYDILHRNYTQMRNDYMGYRREKEEEISSLMSELKLLQDYMNSSGLDKITVEDLKNSNESFRRQNTQIHEDIQRLQEENKVLSGKLKTQEDWKELKSVTQIQLQDLQRENQRYKEELSSFRPQLENLKSQTQSIGRFKFFVTEQCMNMRNQITSVERELSQLYGDGPPSLREAWGSLKSIINIFTNKCMDEEGGTNKYNEGNVGSAPYNGGSTGSVPVAYGGSTGSVPNTYGGRFYEANSQFIGKKNFSETTSLPGNSYGGGNSFVPPYNHPPKNLPRGNVSQRDDVSWQNRNQMSHDKRHY